jgi:hypothetical protein
MPKKLADAQHNLLLQAHADLMASKDATATDGCIEFDGYWGVQIRTIQSLEAQGFASDYDRHGSPGNWKYSITWNVNRVFEYVENQQKASNHHA